VTELQKAKRRVKIVRATRRGSELEGSRSTDATRADQVAYARGTITAAQLRDLVGAVTTRSNRAGSAAFGSAGADLRSVPVLVGRKRDTSVAHGISLQRTRLKMHSPNKLRLLAVSARLAGKPSYPSRDCRDSCAVFETSAGGGALNQMRSAPAQCLIMEMRGDPSYGAGRRVPQAEHQRAGVPRRPWIDARSSW
jgi:hypothetical protein